MPPARLQDVIVNILAGYESLPAGSHHLRADLALAKAWRRERGALHPPLPSSILLRHIVVHLYGHPVDMDPVLDIARKHALFVVEDAAEALGAEYKGRRVGSLGDIATFSFYGNKIITTGEGG